MNHTGWIFMGAILIYFLPTILAARHPNSTPIFALNLFLGWTVIGWVMAFVWACTAPSIRESSDEIQRDQSALRRNVNSSQRRW